MMHHLIRLSLVAAGLSAAITAFAAPIIYPAKGQSASQQQSDDGACYSWAKTNTGVDPAVVASVTAPPPPAPGGQRVVGAAVGATTGAIIGGDSQSAGVGAAVGVVGGGVAARRKNSQAAAASQQQEAAKQNAMSTFYRAYGGCMTGRGYTVS